MTSRKALLLAAIAVGAMPVTVSAQSMPYGSVSEGGEAESSSGGSGIRARSRGSDEPRQKRSEITPYIEVSQIVDAELAPGSDVRVAVECDGALSLSFHQVEGGAAFLVANRVAEQTAEQTNVVPQRTVWLVLEVHG